MFWLYVLHVYFVQDHILPPGVRLIIYYKALLYLSSGDIIKWEYPPRCMMDRSNSRPTGGTVQEYRGPDLSVVHHLATTGFWESASSPISCPRSGKGGGGTQIESTQNVIQLFTLILEAI